MSPKLYTTREAAEAVGITRATIQEWIRRGKFAAPRPRLRGSVGMRLWTESDVARLRVTKERIYRKGGGRPPKRKR